MRQLRAAVKELYVMLDNVAPDLALRAYAGAQVFALIQQQRVKDDNPKFNPVTSAGGISAVMEHARESGLEQAEARLQNTLHAVREILAEENVQAAIFLAAAGRHAEIGTVGDEPEEPQVERVARLVDVDGNPLSSDV